MNNNLYIKNALELLKNSSIVISHRSTTLFEGIARGIPVIIPNLGECKNKKYKPYIFKFSDADKDLITVNTKKDLIETINNLLKMRPKVETKLSKTNMRTAWEKRERPWEKR